MKHIDPKNNMGRAETRGERTLRAVQLSYQRLFEAETALDRSPAGLEQMPRGDESILVVEDEAWLRSLTRRILQTCGYQVLEASQGEEALRLAETHAGPLHLVILDLVLPGISGPVLARRLEQWNSRMRTLYVSGYSEDAVIRHGVLEAGTAFLHKPYTPVLLAQKVRSVLDC